MSYAKYPTISEREDNHMFGFFRKKLKKENDSELKKKKDINKTESEQLESWRKLREITNHRLIILAIIGLSTIFSGIGLYVYKEIQNDLISYSDMVVSTTNNIEDFDTVCNSTEANDQVMEYVKADKIYDIHKDLRVNVTNLINQREILGRRSSYETYAKVGDLICWGSAIWSSGLDVCNKSILIKTPEQVDRWRRVIIMSIEQDKEYHQQFSVALADFYNYIASLFSRKKAAYEDVYSQMPDCNIEEIERISKYIDSLK